MSTDAPIPSEHDADGYALIGACFEVYNEMGNGYLEDVYQESLEIELTDRNIAFVAHPKLPIFYKGRPLRKHYEADLLVLDKIIVELKAAKALLPEHEAQLLNYLKATGCRVGYLVNFGAFPKLDWKRRVR
ncbi:MAG: GxxExxY protein [Opitutus sp.]|nr:GxxExxY protein [Opitutus sp.]